MSNRKSFDDPISFLKPFPEEGFESNVDELRFIKENLRVAGKRVTWEHFIGLFKTNPTMKWTTLRDKSWKEIRCSDVELRVLRLELGLTTPYHALVRSAFAVLRESDNA